MRTIRAKMFITMLMLSLLAMGGVMATVYQSAYTMLRTNEMLYNVEATDRTKEQFEFALDLVYKTAAILSENQSIQQDLRETHLSGTRATEEKNTVSSILKTYVHTLSTIAGVHVVGRADWQLFSSIPSVDEAEIRKTCAPYFSDQGMSRLPNRFTERKQISYYPGVHQGVLQYLTPIYDLDTSAILGVIVIDINYGMLEEMFLASSKQNEDKALIVSSGKDILFKYPYNVTLDSVIEDYPDLVTDHNSRFTGQVFGVPMLIVSDTIDYTDWRIVRMISMNRITKDTQSLQRQMVPITCLYVAVSVILSGILAQLLTAPIKKMLVAFQKAEQGDLSVRARIHTRDEMEKLGDGFNIMMEKLDEGFKLQLESQKKKSDMELEVLQAQINPHFLYNSLDSIKWLAMLQGINNIAQMTTALINLLRYNLSKDGPYVTLREEVESVEHYLCVQKYRYGDGLALEKDLAEDTLDFPMLRFLLQPLVENCVVHAFGHMDEVGIIHIESRIEDGLFIVKVIDNGVGMDVDAALYSEDKGCRFNNIGISNIRERLRLHFGDAAQLRYESRVGFGTTAELILPARPNRP